MIGQWNFQSDESTYMIDDYPESRVNTESSNNQIIALAPGEGKVPTNILYEKDWESKTFPNLLPDGKNSLHEERQIKLTPQQYFVQRILNIDPRFATNSQYLFAATCFVEQLQLERNIHISFLRGKKKVNSDNIATYHLEDHYSVLENIKNTPRYWKKMRNVQYIK